MLGIAVMPDGRQNKKRSGNPTVFFENIRKNYCPIKTLAIAFRYA